MKYRPIYLHSTMQWFTKCCGAICSQPNQEHQGEPLLLIVKVLGSLTCIEQTWDLWLYVQFEEQVSCLRTQVSRPGLEPTLCWSETELRGTVIIIIAGLSLFMKLSTVTQLLAEDLKRHARTHACSYWVKVHNSMFSHRPALIMMTFHL